MPPHASSAATAAFSVRAWACKITQRGHHILGVVTVCEDPNQRGDTLLRASEARPTPADGSAITVYELTCGPEPLP